MLQSLRMGNIRSRRSTSRVFAKTDVRVIPLCDLFVAGWYKDTFFEDGWNVLELGYGVEDLAEHCTDQGTCMK